MDTHICKAAASLSVWLGAACAAAAELPPQLINLDSEGVDVVAADFHERDRVDLVVISKRRTPTAPAVGELLLLRNDGQGGFGTPPAVIENQPPMNFGLAADVDGKKRPSLVAVGGADNRLLAVYRPISGVGEGPNTFEAMPEVQLPFAVQYRPASADAYNTGREDLALGLAGQTGLLRNDGEGRFRFLRVFGPESGDAAICFGQARSNPLTQLIVGTRRLLFLDIQNVEHFGMPTGLNWPVLPAEHLAAGYFVNPQRVDVVACKGAMLALFENTGTGAFPFAAFKDFGDQTIIADLATGDFDGDKITDFATLNPYRDPANQVTAIHIFTVLPGSLTGEGRRLAVEGRGKRLIAADLNGNQKADLAVLSTRRSRIDLLTVLLDPVDNR